MEKQFSLEQTISRLVIAQLIWYFVVERLADPLMSVLEQGLSVATRFQDLLYYPILYLIRLIFYLIPIVLLLGGPPGKSTIRSPNRSKVPVVYWGMIGVGVYYLLICAFEFVFRQTSAQYISRDPNWEYLWLFLFSVPMEEIVYRGFVCRYLARYNRTLAITLSAYLFAVIHAGIFKGICSFAFGVVCGYLYLETGKLIFPCLLHYLVNVFNGLFFPFYIQQNPDKNWDLLAITAISLCMIGACLLILKKKAQKNHEAEPMAALKHLACSIHDEKEDFKIGFVSPPMLLIHFITILTGLQMISVYGFY